ncbi:MAG TPA: DUF2339 domain-containing protein, partial [Thermoanaerobaculia bacterium]|nr:DUF2339 domain-containing protein [Thermoanaerobaculia bacterium]
MLAFLALVVAVIALVVASNARRELRELRELLEGWSGDRRQPAETVIEPAEPVIDTGGLKPAAPQEMPPPPPAPTPPPRTWDLDWESIIGIKLFSWIGGILLVLSLVFLFKYSVEHGWLRPAVRAVFGFVIGIGLLVVCELRVARNYKFTANAMLGAGIAILYATLFALHGRWGLWPAPAAFFGMLLVTAAAVYLSTRRDSVFIALLGLLGGFATPALLSSGENRPIALFSYLLLLNGGIAWIAYRKGWPLLTALSVALTAFYQWTWVERFLTASQLPLAAVIFGAFAIVAGVSLASDRGAAFRRIAGAGAVLPLLFAFFTAIVPEYGARYNVLFGFLLLIAAGLAAISLWRGAVWLHSLGGAATLLTFFIWLTVSYTHESWPWSLAWLGAFVALYLAVGVRLHTAAVYAAPLLFFVFIGLSVREPQQFLTVAGAMFALLAVVVVAKPAAAPIAIALSSIAMLTMENVPAWLSIGAQAVLFATLFVLASISRRHWLAPAAIPFFVAASFMQETHAQQLTAAAILYALFLLYPASLRARIGDAVLPHLAASMAGIVFFGFAYVLRDELGYADYIGVVPLAQALLMLALAAQLLRYEPMPPRLELV